MATYTIEYLSDEPIFIITLLPEFSLARDLLQEQAEVKAFLDSADRHYFYVLDISLASISIDDVIMAANVGARGKAGEIRTEGETSVWRHPNTFPDGKVLITTNNFIKLAARGLNTTAFGNLNVHTVESREEALLYCREKLAESGFTHQG